MNVDMWLCLGWSFLLLGFGWYLGAAHARSVAEDDREADDDYAAMLRRARKARRVYTPPVPAPAISAETEPLWGFARAQNAPDGFEEPDPYPEYPARDSAVLDVPQRRSGPLPPVWPPVVPAWDAPEPPDWAITTDVMNRILDWDAYAAEVAA